MTIVRVRCAYCDAEGEFGKTVEARNGKFACIDVVACDERERARHEEDEGRDER